MCKFHTAVSFEAAIDPVTGELHRGHEALLRCALGNFWLERYMPEVGDIGGYSSLQMGAPHVQEIFKQSRLCKPLEQIKSEKPQAIACLRRRLKQMEEDEGFDLSPKGLHIPHGIYALALDAFLDKAVEFVFYEGDPKTENFVLKNSIEEKEFEPLFLALKKFIDDNETKAALRTLIEGSMATLFIKAPQISNAWLKAAYNGLPDKGRAIVDYTYDTGRSFWQGFATGGTAAIVGHGIHYSLMAGASIGGAAAGAVGIVGSALAIGTLYGAWRKFAGGEYRPLKDHVQFAGVQTAFSAVFAVGIALAMPHNHMGGEEAMWFVALPHAMQEFEVKRARAIYGSLPNPLQERVLKRAGDIGVSMELFLLKCDGTDPVMREVYAHIRGRIQALPGIEKPRL